MCITPLVITSSDEGESWSEPREFTPYAGRVYDAVYYKGDIYALLFCNDAKNTSAEVMKIIYTEYISKMEQKRKAFYILAITFAKPEAKLSA